jgi:5,10-methylenetetrahydrofolate reductase
MPRPLFEALRTTPLFFEPAPPSARTPAARVEERISEIVRLAADVPRLDAFNVPELVDENHEGRPFYRSADPRAYARAIGERTGLEVIVNKVVAHVETPALERWATETAQAGLRHVVLVGGSSRYIPYPGPSVVEADRLCRPILGGAGGLLGNIAIPQREGEAHRMLVKTRSGAAFFTTQLLFDSDAPIRMLREYDRLCRQAAIAPAAVVLSFAPLADEQDAEFVQWLGADLPEAAEREILEGDEVSAGPHSIERAVAVWKAVQTASQAAEVAVPIGVNVEQISLRHLAVAKQLLLAFAATLPPAGGALGSEAPDR